MAESEAGRAKGSFARTPSRNRTVALWAAALVTIALGFADLARGGTTIAPVLLVLGYCVLVPLAILK
jgi:hypothetical protein